MAFAQSACFGPCPSVIVNFAAEPDSSEQLRLHGVDVFGRGDVDREEACVGLRKPLLVPVVFERDLVLVAQLTQLDGQARAAPREPQVQSLIVRLHPLEDLPQPLDVLVVLGAALILRDRFQSVDVKLLHSANSVVHLIGGEEAKDVQRDDLLDPSLHPLDLLLARVEAPVDHQTDVLFQIRLVNAELGPARAQLNNLAVRLLRESLVNDFAEHVVRRHFVHLFPQILEHRVRQLVDSLYVVLRGRQAHDQFPENGREIERDTVVGAKCVPNQIAQKLEQPLVRRCLGVRIQHKAVAVFARVSLLFRCLDQKRHHSLFKLVHHIDEGLSIGTPHVYRRLSLELDTHGLLVRLILLPDIDLATNLLEDLAENCVFSLVIDLTRFLETKCVISVDFHV